MLPPPALTLTFLCQCPLSYSLPEEGQPEVMKRIYRERETRAGQYQENIIHPLNGWGSLL